MSQRFNLLCSGLFFAVLGTGFLVYMGGLHGPFLFDDFVNLDRLDKYGALNNLSSVLDYLFGGLYGTGRLVSSRPVAFASFLLDTGSWPSDPYPFKYHNLLFHLLAAVALFWFSLLISRCMGFYHRTACLIALTTMALWTLHPLHVSTVLYAVQRMTILSALFVLFGLGLYLSGRLDLAAARTRRGFGKITLAVGVFMPLAVLSKENGALFPLLVVVLESTVLRKMEVSSGYARWFRAWEVVFIYIPILVLVLYTVITWDTVSYGYLTRDFTLEQRLLTQPRVLLGYLSLLLLPRMQTSGLYNDDYQFSTALLSPWTTMPAILLIGGLILLGVSARNRWPLLSLAVLFYFCGHLIESSFVPLELYFEHRNYLPSTMLFFFVAVKLIRFSEKHPRWPLMVLLGVFSTYSALTYARTDLWSDPSGLALVWAKSKPQSIRAQQQAAIFWSFRGRLDKSLEHLMTALEHHPFNPDVRLQVLALSCGSGDITPEQLSLTGKALVGTRYTSAVIRGFQNLIRLKRLNSCAALSHQELLALIDTTLANPGLIYEYGIQGDLYYLKGLAYISSGEKKKAIEAFNQAFTVAPLVDIGMQIVGVLATNQEYVAAKEVLHMVEIKLGERAGKGEGLVFFYQSLLQRGQQQYGAEIERIRKELDNDIALSKTQAK